MSVVTTALAEIQSVLPHFASGPIVKGFGRGSRELGFPTANFSEEVIDQLPDQLVGGIYHGLAKVDEGPVLDMVLSVGFNPFYNNEKRAMETHIIHEFPGDLYDRHLRVIILGFLRPEKNYPSLSLLVEAIQGDIMEGQKRNGLDLFVKYKTHKFFDDQKQL